MVLLNYISLVLLVATIAKGDLDASGLTKDVVGHKLARRLVAIKKDESLAHALELHAESESPVTDLELRAEGESPVTAIVLGGQRGDTSVALGKPRCPDFSDVLATVKKTVSDISAMATSAIDIFGGAANNTNCHVSLNPIKTLKCFLRVFAVGYKQLSTVIVKAGSVKNDIEDLISEYRKYSTKCNGDWSFTNTLELVDLFKFVQQTVADL